MRLPYVNFLTEFWYVYFASYYFVCAAQVLLLLLFKVFHHNFICQVLLNMSSIESDAEEQRVVCKVCNRINQLNAEHCSFICFLLKQDVERNDNASLASSLLSEIQDFKQLLADLRHELPLPFDERISVTTNRVDFIMQHLFNPDGGIVHKELPSAAAAAIVGDTASDIELRTPEDLSVSAGDDEECAATDALESSEVFDSEDFITDVDAVVTEEKILKRKCPDAPQKPTRLAPSVFYSTKRVKK